MVGGVGCTEAFQPDAMPQSPTRRQFRRSSSAFASSSVSPSPVLNGGVARSISGGTVNDALPASPEPSPTNNKRRGSVSLENTLNQLAAVRRNSGINIPNLGPSAVARRGSVAGARRGSVGGGRRGSVNGGRRGSLIAAMGAVGDRMGDLADKVRLKRQTDRKNKSRPSEMWESAVMHHR